MLTQPHTPLSKTDSTSSKRDSFSAQVQSKEQSYLDSGILLGEEETVSERLKDWCVLTLVLIFVLIFILNLVLTLVLIIVLTLSQFRQSSTMTHLFPFFHTDLQKRPSSSAMRDRKLRKSIPIATKILPTWLRWEPGGKGEGGGSYLLGERGGEGGGGGREETITQLVFLVTLMEMMPRRFLG